MPLLEVHQLGDQDIYKDIIRVNEVHRKDKNKNPIKEGKICQVSADGRKCFAVLRGYQEDDAPQIRMDDFTRINKLDLQRRKSYEFEFKPVGVFGQLRWAWNATEMGYQVASRLGVLGFVLGILGLLFSLAAFVDWHWVWSILH
jgi:hypothetical protein